jgi:uncharacterized protein (DUF1778 family)
MRTPKRPKRETPVTVSLRKVPARLHLRMKVAAAVTGMSLQDFILHAVLQRLSTLETTNVIPKLNDHEPI